MSRTSGRNGRVRRSGGRAAPADTPVLESEIRESVPAASEEGDTGVDGEVSPEEQSVSAIMEDDALAAKADSCAAEKCDVTAEAQAVPEESTSCAEVCSSAAEDGTADAPVPGDLDLLRGELMAEELEQSAVEQMFRWAKRDRAGEEQTEEGAEEKLSGQALLEAVHHGRHVAALAVDLFESLAGLFPLDARWARILAQAALWHDLGFAVSGRRRHHKVGMEIVEQNPELSLSFGLEEADRPLVALLVRYHRRAWPSMKHRRFAALCREDRRSLAGAAALLRMADGLDYRHRGAVEEIRVKLRRRAVGIVCLGSGSCRKECRRALKKGDLFEKICGRALEISQGKEDDRYVC